MAYKTGKKCFFCLEQTLTYKKVGKKVICNECINELSCALELERHGHEVKEQLRNDT